MPGPVVVAEYDSLWPDDFERERRRIVAALGELALAIEHHGSTSVPSLAAKPILDIMVAVTDLSDVAGHTERLEAAGYKRRAVGDLPGRVFFQGTSSAGLHLHLSLCELDGDFRREHLVFRDALRGDPELARRYADLKRELALRYRDDALSYTEAKTCFVRAALERAMGENPRSGWAGEEPR